MNILVIKCVSVSAIYAKCVVEFKNYKFNLLYIFSLLSILLFQITLNFNLHSLITKLQ